MNRRMELYSRNRERIFDVLKGNPGINISRLAEKVGLSRKAVRKHLNNLLKEGLAIKQGIKWYTPEELLRSRITAIGDMDMNIYIFSPSKIEGFDIYFLTPGVVIRSNVDLSSLKNVADLTQIYMRRLAADIFNHLFERLPREEREGLARVIAYAVFIGYKYWVKIGWVRSIRFKTIRQFVEALRYYSEMFIKEPQYRDYRVYISHLFTVGLKRSLMELESMGRGLWDVRYGELMDKEIMNMLYRYDALREWIVKLLRRSRIRPADPKQMIRYIDSYYNILCKWIEELNDVNFIIQIPFGITKLDSLLYYKEEAMKKLEK